MNDLKSFLRVEHAFKQLRLGHWRLAQTAANGYRETTIMRYAKMLGITKEQASAAVRYMREKGTFEEYAATFPEGEKPAKPYRSQSAKDALVIPDLFYDEDDDSAPPIDMDLPENFGKDRHELLRQRKENK